MGHAVVWASISLWPKRRHTPLLRLTRTLGVADHQHRLHMNPVPVALWHFTKLSNLESILVESQLFSQAAAAEKNIRQHYYSDSQSRKLDTASGRADYVFLSLAPCSLFFLKTAFGSPHVWIRCSPDLLREPGLKLTNGKSLMQNKPLVDLNHQQIELPMALINSDARIGYRPDGGPDLQLLRYQPKLDLVTAEALSTEILVPKSINLCRWAEGIYKIEGNMVEALFLPVERRNRE